MYADHRPIAAHLDPVSLAFLQTLPGVESIEEDGVMQTTSTQSVPLQPCTSVHLLKSLFNVGPMRHGASPASAPEPSWRTKMQGQCNRQPSVRPRRCRAVFPLHQLISQHSQLNFKYTYDDSAGAGVDIYIIGGFQHITFPTSTDIDMNHYVRYWRSSKSYRLWRPGSMGPNTCFWRLQVSKTRQGRKSANVTEV
jgi:hypothetical protein